MIRSFVLALTLAAALLGGERHSCALGMGTGGFCSAPSAFATWNSSDKSASVTLTGSSLIATVSANGGVRSTTSHASGKYYLEATCGTLDSGNPFAGIGFTTGSAPLTDAPGSSAGTGGIGIKTLGDIWQNNTFQVTDNGGPISGTHVIRLALDADNHAAWIALTGGTASGNWNESSSANPASNTGGIAVPSSTFFIMFSGFSNNDACTINTGQTNYSFSKPSGFSDW